MLLLTSCSAQVNNLPDAPLRSKTFLALTSAGAAVTFLDSFNTGKIAGHFAKERFGEGPQRPCLAEVGQPWLYGKHPGEGIAWVIGAGKVALFSGLAYRMKLHHNRFWVFPEAGMLMATPDVVTGIKNCD